MKYVEYEEIFLTFSRLFKEGFDKPNLKSQKFIELWYDVDLLMSREVLAGPFYNVDMHYNCDYVFEGNHEQFKEIRSCEDFLNWCLDNIKFYKSKIIKEVAADAIEEEDRRLLLFQAEIMKKLSFMVYDIQKERWKAINKPY